MLLHQLKLTHKRKYPKPRVGRGGKRGTTAGHGTKGQKSRSGHRIRPAERDFIQRLPKLRGFKFRRVTLRQKPEIVNLDQLSRIGGSVVNPNSLKEARLVRGTVAGGIKILGRGKLSKSFVVEHVHVSQSARKKIEAAGGSIRENKSGDE